MMQSFLMNAFHDEYEGARRIILAFYRESSPLSRAYRHIPSSPVSSTASTYERITMAHVIQGPEGHDSLAVEQLRQTRHRLYCAP
jgi:hypothetical protein